MHVFRHMYIHRSFMCDLKYTNMRSLNKQTNPGMTETRLYTLGSRRCKSLPKANSLKGTAPQWLR